MVCTHPTELIDKATARVYQTVPCGKCMPCRIQRTSQWALRLMNELPYFDYKATFLTLTYDDEHLPSDFGLHKEDLQKFFKRLRRDLDYKIKYYACGEYGDLYGRPHYHAIVFGLDYSELNRQIVKDNWQLCSLDRFDYSPFKKKENGFAPVTPDDIRYVTGYIQKKLNGKEAEKAYGNRQPPFSVTSQGLGLRYALDHVDDIRNGSVTYNGHFVSVPRYYLQKTQVETDSRFGVKHKIDYLDDKGISVKEIPPSKFEMFLNYTYDKLSRSSLEAYDKEINARYNME